MSSVPEHCQELKKCKSTARIGCTVAAMRVELRRRGVQGVSALNKGQLCQLLHSVQAQAPIAAGVFPEKCVRPKVCNTRAPSGCGVVNLRDHIRRTDPDVKGVWKMNKDELCKQPAVHTKPISPAASASSSKQKPATMQSCMTDFTVKNLRPLLAKLNLNDVFPWKMTKGQLCEKVVTAPRKAPPKVNYIWGNALRLSGPIGATVFQLPHNKQIYLFGDNHAGIKYQCPKNDKDAIGIVDLLVNTFRSRPGPENTDLFIETWDAAWKEERIARKTFDAILLHVDRRFRGEFKKRAKNVREFPSTRVHYADPRYTTFNDAWSFDTVDSRRIRLVWTDILVKKYIDSPAKAKAYIKLFVTSDRFSSDMRALFPLYKGTETRHIIRKQLAKLGAKDRKFLLDRVDKELDYVFAAVNDEIFAKYRKALLSKSMEIAEKITTKIAGDIGGCLMDTYLLARLIYYVNKQTAGGLTVVYVGEDHKVEYANALAKLYGPPVFNRNDTHIQMHKGLDELRCIDLGPTQNKEHELSENVRFWDKGGPRDRQLLSKL